MRPRSLSSNATSSELAVHLRALAHVCVQFMQRVQCVQCAQCVQCVQCVPACACACAPLLSRLLSCLPARHVHAVRQQRS